MDTRQHPFRFIFALLAAFLTACGTKETQDDGHTSGNINSLVVVMSDPLWNGEVGDSLRKKLAAPVDGLPQEEPLFNINQYAPRFLDDFRNAPRNLVIVKEQKEADFRIEHDEYASPQITVHLSGTPEDIIGTLELNADSIIRVFKAGEINASIRNMEPHRLDDTHIRKKFGVTLAVPGDYKYAMKRRNFVWLKRDVMSGSSSLLIYKVPLRSIQKGSDIARNIIRARDSVGRLYIHGRARHSRMITEESYAPYFLSTTLCGRRAYETKGTWELRNDFMNGPFINYAIIDRKRRRCLIVEGFCYAPSAQKRDMVHELEASIRSLRIIEKE